MRVKKPNFLRSRIHLLYGLIAGGLLLGVHAMKYHVMIRDLRIEVFAFTIAAMSLVLGVWLGKGALKSRRPAAAIRETNPTSKLSDREVEVLQLLSEGHSNQEIADRLFVSLNTVKTHLAKIYQKLSVSRRVQAVQKAKAFDIIA